MENVCGRKRKKKMLYYISKRKELIKIKIKQGHKKQLLRLFCGLPIFLNVRITLHIHE